MRSKDAILHMKKTGNVNEAMDIVCGRRTIHEQGEAHQQTQSWFLPDQDALNQSILRLINKLPDSTYNVEKWAKDGKGGYLIKVSGKYADHDLASLFAVKGGCMRMDRMPGQL